MTNEEVRSAILQAADHIEVTPSAFSYGSCIIPAGRCGSPGCAVGWIGFFANCSRLTSMSMVCRDVLKLPVEVSAWGTSTEYVAFENRMTLINPLWRYSSNVAASLRLYADKYHPLPKEPPFITELKALAAKELVT